MEVPRKSRKDNLPHLQGWKFPREKWPLERQPDLHRGNRDLEKVQANDRLWVPEDTVERSGGGRGGVASLQAD